MRIKSRPEPRKGVRSPRSYSLRSLVVHFLMFPRREENSWKQVRSQEKARDIGKRARPGSRAGYRPGLAAIVRNNLLFGCCYAHTLFFGRLRTCLCVMLRDN